MADSSKRLPKNVPGPWYVDDACIDCDLCRETAPLVFQRDDENGHSFVFHQPETEEELRQAEEAKSSCPVESIGSDGLPAPPPALSAADEPSSTDKPKAEAPAG